MMDKPLRQIKDQTLNPIVKRMGHRLHPNLFTGVGTLLAVAAAVSAFSGAYVIGLIFWMLNRAMDGLDGAYARVWDKKSDLGGYLDTMSDFFTYAIIPFGFALHNPTTEGLILLAFLLGTFYVNAAAFMYLGAILDRQQSDKNGLTSLRMPRGLIEGGETIIFYCAFFIFNQYIDVLFVMLGLLVIATTLQHVVWSMKNL